MKYLKIIKRYIPLVFQGLKLKDKLIIFSYFLFNAPINMLSKHKNHKLLGDVTVKSKDGIFFSGRNIFPVWAGSSFHEPEMRKYFNLDKGIFVDVGANIGKYTVIVGKALKNNGKVISFEPMPENFEILKKNIKLNKINNVFTFECGLGDKEEKLDLYLDEVGVGGGAHSLVKDNPNTTNNKIKITIRKLDNIVKELKLNRVDLIKIDVEGFESNVLIGAIDTLKKYHPKIIFEVWDKTYLNKVKNVLELFNYQIKKIAEENYLAY